MSETFDLASRLELRQLEIFCAVVRLSSFSDAAREVELAQSTVSERISALEEQVGTQLLVRSRRRGVRPTAVGEVLYRRAVALLRERQRVVREVRRAMGAAGGLLHLGASTTPAAYYLPPALRAFRDANPKTRFSVEVGNSDAVLDWVADGVVEMGIAGDPGEHRIEDAVKRRGPLAVEARLWRDELVVAMAPEHPWAGRETIGAAELLAEPLVLREPGSATRRCLERLLEESVPGGAAEIEVAAELGDASAVTQAVRCGIGVAVLPRVAIDVELAAGALAAAAIDPALERRFYLIHGPRSTSPLCRRFAAALKGE